MQTKNRSKISAAMNDLSHIHFITVVQKKECLGDVDSENSNHSLILADREIYCVETS